MNRFFPSAAVPLSQGRQKGAVTFAQTAERWLLDKKSAVKPSTYAVYGGILENHLLPPLGALDISGAGAWDLQRLLSDMLLAGRRDGTGGLSPKTVADIRAVLCLVLRYAQDRGLCAPTARAPLPVNPVQRTQVLTRAEQRLLEQCLLEKAEPFRTGVLLALYSGVRIGELCALQWKDFSFADGTVRVEKTLLRVRDSRPEAPGRTRVVLQRPKTPNSERTIPLPRQILGRCAQMCRRPEDFVLTGSGRYMEPRACLKRYKRLLIQAQVADHTFHALRHTFATRCVESGFDTKSLSEIMGHASVRITMQRYVHPSMEMKRRQMERLTLLEG